MLGVGVSGDESGQLGGPREHLGCWLESIHCMLISDPFSAFLFLDLCPGRQILSGCISWALLWLDLQQGLVGGRDQQETDLFGLFLPCFLLAPGPGSSCSCITQWLLQLLPCTPFPLFQLSLGSSSTVFLVPLLVQWQKWLPAIARL